MSGEDAFHFDPNSVCGMEGLGQSPFPGELMIAYVSSLSRAHMPGAGNTTPPPPHHRHCIPLAYPTDSDQEGAGVLSDHLLTTRLSAPILPHGHCQVLLRAMKRELLPGETLENFGPQCGNYDQLSGASWSALKSQFSLSPLCCPNQADLHSVLRLHLLTWLMLLGYFILLLFWPKCYLPLTTQTKFHVSLEVYCVQHIPQIFSSPGFLKECSYILIYAHHPSNLILISLTTSLLFYISLSYTIFKVLVFSFLYSALIHKILK